MSRFVQPASDKIDLTDGDWLIVKRQLTAGEQRRAFARTIKTLTLGQPGELNPEGIGLAKIVAYLLDWSLTDADGRPVVVRDQPDAILEGALLAMTPESFREIHDAITAHESRQADALEAEKKTRTTAPELSLISRSAG